MTDSAKGFDSDAFYKALSATVVARGVTWKHVSEKTGVSQTTLALMAQGRKPDAASFAALSAWAQLPVERFVHAEWVAEKPEPLAEAIAILRADANLSPESKDALTSMITAAYMSMRWKGAQMDPGEAVLTETGYGLDAIGLLDGVRLPRLDAEPDDIYRTRLISRMASGC